MGTPQYRHEFKYLISIAQIPLLKSRISGFMKPDPHTGPDNIYSIRSLYFDDYHNHCFYENENGTDPREKFRIRIYNRSNARITLECKRKEHGKTLKTSCPLTMEEAQALIAGSPLSISDSGCPALLRKLELKRRTEGMHPVVIVEYDRMPYVYREGNVRVTFDTNIASASDPACFFDPVLPKRPVLPTGQHLLEVKYDAFLPDPIYHSLNLEQLRQTAFSKYYLCRRYSL